MLSWRSLLRPPKASTHLLFCNFRGTRNVEIPDRRYGGPLSLTLASRVRCYSTTPVDLSYTSVIPSDGNETNDAVVILHGLFGSKRNFASLCKAFMRDLDRPIYALDLRNHGSSPHATPMTYESMAEDVRHFIEAKKLKDVSLFGHSMGGKVAMTLALSPSPPDISNLIISDISPKENTHITSNIPYLQAMSKIEDSASNIKTRDAAGKVLEAVEKDLGVRQFLLTNLILPDASDPSRTTAKFQIPVSILTEAIPALGVFPFVPDGEHKWPGRTLIVKGSRSNYITETDIPVFKSFFPSMRLEILDTGHWVHAEKPNEFKKIFVEFLLERNSV